MTGGASWHAGLDELGRCCHHGACPAACAAPSGGRAGKQPVQVGRPTRRSIARMPHSRDVERSAAGPPPMPGPTTDGTPVPRPTSTPRDHPTPFPRTSTEAVAAASVEDSAELGAPADAGFAPEPGAVDVWGLVR